MKNHMNRFENEMCKNLIEAYNIILRLIDGDIEVMKTAVEEAVEWLNNNTQYARKELH